MPPIYRILLPSLLICAAGPGRAQVLPPAQPITSVVAGGQPVTLTFAVAPAVPAKIALYDLGGLTPLSETDARLVPGPNGHQVTLRLDAEPGVYEARLITADKLRKPLAAPIRLVVPGLRREPGWWLLNGSIFSSPATESATPTTILPNLARGGKTKFPVSLTASDGKPLAWRTIPLPPLTTIAAPGFDFAALTSTLRAELAKPGGPAVGFALPARAATPTATPVTITPEQKKSALAQLRTSVNAVAPGAAIILTVEGNDPLSSQDVDTAGAACDAMLFHYRGAPANSDLWNLKVARRIVEEQPDYDLPLLVNFEPVAEQNSDRFLFDCFMGGATGLILPPGYRPTWADLVENNFPLFAGAVTLEDAPLPNLPLSPAIYNALRDGGRIPLMGRLPTEDKKRGEPLMILLDSSTTAAMLDGIKEAASQGATMYIEGLPDLAKPELVTKLAELTGTTITPLPKPVSNVLTLQDPWLFGLARGVEFTVQQSLTLKPKGSMAAQARAERGLDNLLAPRFAASLADDPAGLLVYGVGKGRVIWLPHALPLTGADTSLAYKRAEYYSAIAGTIQSSLIRYKVPEGSHIPYGALRMSKGKTSLVALFNDRAQPLTTTVSGRGLSEVALDLATGQPIQTTQRGYETTFNLTIPANGWSLVALAESRKEYEKERNAKRGKGSLK